MKLKHSALTYKPEGKAVNQDSYYSAPSDGLFLISDGIGGYKHSEFAARVARDRYSRCIEGIWSR